MSTADRYIRENRLAVKPAHPAKGETMIKPLDEFEAELYEDSTALPALRMWHFLASSIGFFTLGAMIVVIPQTISTSSVAHPTYISLGGLFIFMGAALLSGWLLGVTVAIGTRIAERTG